MFPKISPLLCLPSTLNKPKVVVSSTTLSKTWLTWINVGQSTPTRLIFRILYHMEWNKGLANLLRSESPCRYPVAASNLSCSQRSPLFEISPQATKDPRRGFLYLPYGAKIYTFSPRARQNLKPYLKEQLPNWLQHLNGLREQQRALPIILTAVWASRSLACASYRISPPNTSATLQLLKDLDGEKVEWARAPEGFSTHIAPLASEGYDQYGRLKSNVEDQSFAIEGYGVLKKEIAWPHRLNSSTFVELWRFDYRKGRKVDFVKLGEGRKTDTVGVESRWGDEDVYGSCCWLGVLPGEIT